MQDVAAFLPTGVLVLDAESRLAWVNPFARDLLGYDGDDLLGQRVDALLTVASRIYFQTHIYPLLSLGKLANELYLTLQTRQRSPVPVLLNAGRADHGGRVLTYLSFVPVYQRREYEQELLAAKKAAEDALLRNDELLRLQAELERHQVQLDRQMNDLRQRNDDLEQFGKIISHDLQEPLRKINLYASLLAAERPDALSRLGATALDAIDRASSRLRELILDLQSYYTLSSADVQPLPVDLTELVRRVAREFDSPEAAFDVQPLPAVLGNPDELTNLFRYLLDNAVKFRKPDQPAQVRVEGTVVGRNSFRATPGKYHYADYARIRVSDNGTGFDPDRREEVFRIMKKLHSHTPGLGVGLAFARKIVELHNGQIAAETTPGEGTRLTVWLPLG